MYCYKCGKRNNDDAAFCVHCGTALKRKKQVRNETPERKTVTRKEEKWVELLRQLQDGQENVFETLYKESNGRVRYEIIGTGVEERHVEDIVQETYIAVLKNIQNFQCRSEGEARRWIITIAHNKAIDQIRKNRRDVVISPSSSEEDDEPDFFENIADEDTMFLPEKAMDNQETMRALQDMMDELPMKQKMTLLRYYYDNMKLEEIAQLLDTSVGTIKSNLFKAKKNLQEKVLIYQKQTGVKLYAVPAAPVLYAMFREDIIRTVTETGVPAALTAAVGKLFAGGAKATGTAAASGAKATGTAAAGGAKASGTAAASGAKATGTAAAGGAKASGAAAAIKGVAVKAAVGTAVAASIGTAAYVAVNHHAYKAADVQAVVQQVEDACDTLDMNALLECLSEDSRKALEGYDLMLTPVVDSYTNFTVEDIDLTVDDVSFGEDIASAHCVYTVYGSDRETQRVTQSGYVGLVYEHHGWKIKLCRYDMNVFEKGRQATQMRYYDLLHNELIYNDEIESGTNATMKEEDFTDAVSPESDSYSSERGTSGS